MPTKAANKKRTSKKARKAPQQPQEAPQATDENLPRVPWAGKQVEWRDASELRPYDRNARTHSEQQLQQIARSIEKWGWTVPMLVDETNEIIAGHGRLEAATKILKYTRVPVLVAQGWSDEEKRAYVLADNQIALNAGWDNELLHAELSELKDFQGLDLDLIGFDEAFYAHIGLDDSDLNAGTSAADEWNGMPQYQALDPCFRKIVVNFDDQESVDAFAALMEQTINEKTKSLWFPAKQRRDMESMRWVDNTDGPQPDDQQEAREPQEAASE